MKKILFAATFFFAVWISLSICAVCAEPSLFEYNTSRNALSGLDPANVYISNGTYYGAGNEPADASVLYDGKYDTVKGTSGTRWAVESDQNGAYIIIDFGRILEIDQMVLHTGYSDDIWDMETLSNFDVYTWDGTDFVLWEEACTTGNYEHILVLDNIKAVTRKLKIVSRQEESFRIREIIISSPQNNIELKVVYNNSEVNFHTSKPMFVDGSVMVPLEEIADILGITYRWDDDKQQSIVQKGDKELTFTMGEKSIQVGDEIVNIEVAPYLIGSRVYLPLRILAENLENYVFWNSEEFAASVVADDFLHKLFDDSRELSDFSLKADGISKEVFSFTHSDFSQITCTDETDVEITYSEDIATVQILPQKESVVPSISGNKLYFKVQPGQHLCVEVNNAEKPLLVFVNPPSVRPDENDPNVIFLDKQKMYFEPIFRLKDNQTVYLGDDVVVFGGFMLKDKKNVKIIGNGIIYSGQSYCSPVRMMNCENFEIDGPVAIGTGIDYARWNNYWVKSNDIKANNYKILGTNEYSDGIDIVGSTNVILNKIFVRNHDDGICIKGNIMNRPQTNGNVENVLVTNSVISSPERGNSLEIGYEADTDYIRNVTFKDIDIIHRGTISSKFQRAAVSIHNADRAHVSNITYENIRVQRSDENLVFLGVFESTNFGTSDTRGKITDITFKNMMLIDGDYNPPSHIRNSVLKSDSATLTVGEEKAEVNDITFENLIYKGMSVKSIEDAVQCGFVIDPGIDIQFE